MLLSINTYNIVLAMKMIGASNTVKSNNLQQICTAAAVEFQISLNTCLIP